MKNKFYLKDRIIVFQHKLSCFRNVLLGYNHLDGSPKKCPFCKSGDLEVYETFRHDQGFIEEEWIRCKRCKKQVAVWAYGSWMK